MRRSARNGAETSTSNSNRGAIASAALLLFFILVFKFESKQAFPGAGEEQLVYSKYSHKHYDNTDQSGVDVLEDDIDDDENVNDNEYDDYDDNDGDDDYNDVDDNENENDSVSGDGNSIDTSEGTTVISDHSDSDENETLLQQKPIFEKEEKDWGKWKFWDGYTESNGPRPEIKYTSHENRDFPSDDIPDESWHADAVYINHFLDAGMNLVSRTKEAIVAEYGLDNDLPFHINVVDIKKSETGEDELVRSAKKIGGGGWIESKSLDGLMLRLLHAMMTEDEFHVVVAGDSSAVGLGNNFNQSYAVQFHELMEPVFDRFGVKLVTRNMAHRSGATIGMSSLYDSDIDILVWDAPLTESNIGDIEFFHRQAILSGNRVPFLWGGVLSELSNLHISTGADVGIPDWSTEGVPVTKNDAHALELPWAARYLNCEGQFAEICPTHKFNSICWIDRDDITPPTEQKKHPDGQENETNLGFREHRFRGRKLSYLVLTALGRTLDRWMEKSMSEGYPIGDDMWHVSDYFNAIRGKTSNMHDSFCESRMKLLPRLCNVPMKGRSEYTPRFKPDETSIRSILTSSPNGMSHSFPSSVMLYDIFDLPILSQKIPDEALNVVEIAGKRLLRRRSLVENSEIISKSVDGKKKEEEKKTENPKEVNNADGKNKEEEKKNENPEDISVADGKKKKEENKNENPKDINDADGKNKEEKKKNENPNNINIANGKKKEEEKKNENPKDINTTTEWSLMDHLSGYCDGKSSSHCNRNTNSNCLLDGHHDSSSVLIVTSGWITLKIPEITKGIILATLYIADIDIGDSKPTKNENTRNLRNNKNQRRITSDKSNIARFIPEGVLLDISIDGHVRTYQNHELDDFILKTENGFATVVLLDDDSGGNASEKIIRLQLRCKDCTESKTSPHLEISHIYWS